MKLTNKGMAQSVVIHFSNGKVGIFSGPAVVFPEDKDVGIPVGGIKFTMPKKLPKDCYFEEIEKETEGK